MYQSQNQNCSVCGGVFPCSKHKDALVANIHPDFAARLVQVESGSLAWSKFLIKADTPTPVAVWVNPPQVPLTGTPFWVQAVPVKKGIHHFALR